MNKGTYNRKYYLHRRIKSDGFDLQLEHTHKTINVNPDQIEQATKNGYVQELKNKYNYGIQILNPMTNGHTEI